MSQPVRDPFEEKKQKTTTATEVYRSMKIDLMTGALEPGKKLNIQHLSAAYDTSINPVREALNRLTAERLVVQRDQRGFAVPTMSKADIEELVRTRVDVEGLALRRSIENGDDEWETNVVVAFHRFARTRYTDADGAPSVDWEASHRRFHMALLANCGSRRLLEFCDDLMFQAARARYLAVVSGPKLNLRENEHKALMKATAARDVDKAVDLLTTHYQKTASLVLGRL